jgi:hypothetical protein
MNNADKYWNPTFSFLKLDKLIWEVLTEKMIKSSNELSILAEFLR